MGRPSDDEMKAAAESMMLSGAFDEAERRLRVETEADPEYVTAKPTHFDNVFRAILSGIVSADPFFTGYALPPNFERVVNKLFFEFQHKYAEEAWRGEVIDISLLAFEDDLRTFMMDDPAFIAWGETNELIGITHRDSSTPTTRSWMDLDVPARNAMVALRNERRREDNFDKQFDHDWAEGALEGCNRVTLDGVIEMLKGAGGRTAWACGEALRLLSTEMADRQDNPYDDIEHA